MDYRPWKPQDEIAFIEGLTHEPILQGNDSDDLKSAFEHRTFVSRQRATKGGTTMKATWWMSAVQDEIHGGVVELTIHAPHPTRPGCGYTLAEVYGFTREDLEPNGRLIAAAPDLLEALRLFCDVNPNDLDTNEVCYRHDIARAALGKAEPESK